MDEFQKYSVELILEKEKLQQQKAYQWLSELGWVGVLFADRRGHKLSFQVKEILGFGCSFVGADETVNFHRAAYLDRPTLIYVKYIFLKADLIGQLRFESISPTFPT